MIENRDKYTQEQRVGYFNQDEIIKNAIEDYESYNPIETYEEYKKRKAKETKDNKNKKEKLTNY